MQGAKSGCVPKAECCKVLCAVQFLSIPLPPNIFFEMKSCMTASDIDPAQITAWYRTFIMSSLTKLLTISIHYTFFRRKSTKFSSHACAVYLSRTNLFLAPKSLNTKFPQVIQLAEIDWHIDQKQKFNFDLCCIHTHIHTSLYLYSVMVLAALGLSSASTPSWSGWKLRVWWISSSPLSQHVYIVLDLSHKT